MKLSEKSQKNSLQRKKNLQHMFCAAETKLFRGTTLLAVLLRPLSSVFRMDPIREPVPPVTGRTRLSLLTHPACSKKKLRGEILLAFLLPFQQSAALWEKRTPSGRSPSMHFLSLTLFYHVLTDMSIFILTKFLQIFPDVLYNFNGLTQ